MRRNILSGREADMEETASKRERNKAEKKAALIEAAERLFIERGFDNTPIEEAAKEAGVTKRTLYQYFLSKEDLFYSVELKGAKKLLAAYEEAMAKGDTALEKIRLGNLAYLQFYNDNPGLFRIMNYSPANRENTEESPNYRELEVMDGVRLEYFLKLVGEAKADGSIDPGIDTGKAVFFAFFSSFSLLYTVSAMSMWSRLDLGEGDFLRFSFDTIIDALKP
jgi:TetR/AcrR family transcriptional regulator